MQQWYEFTTTKSAALLLMYINTITIDKGAELSELDSWEDVLSCKTELQMSIRARQFNLAFSKCQAAIDTFKQVGYVHHLWRP